ncbi:hypothetical protein [Streptomyces sp. NPDC014995]|uniref:hypothetical protein n=1 Tax=Streptomyces sp. NPDC014995 TaxID=3364936 RepID=UPI0036FF002A
MWEQAGAPSLREIRDRSGAPLALPVSSAARIVKRVTVPADEQQLVALLAGCDVPAERHPAWAAAFAKITGSASAAAAEQTPVDERDAARRRVASRRLLHLAAQQERASSREQQWRRFMDLLPPMALEEIITSGTQSYLAAEAARNGTTARSIKPWQPDFFAVHDGRYVAVELKSTSRNDGRGPQAGGAGKASRRPPGNGGGPAARRESGHGSDLPALTAASRKTAVPGPPVVHVSGSQVEQHDSTHRPPRTPTDRRRACEARPVRDHGPQP